MCCVFRRGGDDVLVLLVAVSIIAHDNSIPQVSVYGKGEWVIGGRKSGFLGQNLQEGECVNGVLFSAFWVNFVLLGY